MLKLFTIICTLVVCIQATLWPLKKQYCQFTAQCFEGECCQAQPYGQRSICVIRDSQTANCLDFIPDKWHKNNKWVNNKWTNNNNNNNNWKPYNGIKQGFCPPRYGSHVCYNDYECSGNQKCCSGKCEYPIYE